MCAFNMMDVIGKGMDEELEVGKMMKEVGIGGEECYLTQKCGEAGGNANKMLEKIILVNASGAKKGRAKDLSDSVVFGAAKDRDVYYCCPDDDSFWDAVEKDWKKLQPLLRQKGWSYEIPYSHEHPYAHLTDIGRIQDVVLRRGRS